MAQMIRRTVFKKMVFCSVYLNLNMYTEATGKATTYVGTSISRTVKTNIQNN